MPHLLTSFKLDPVNRSAAYFCIYSYRRKIIGEAQGLIAQYLSASSRLTNAL
jgi:hypothetical protein